ncbi:hypothetical protein QBC32DRAFT_225716, partial [Pseudoneurospora amorphoporcata]
IHEQFATARNQVREIALAISKEQTKELTTLKEQYKALQKNYNLVTQMFDMGVKASQNQQASIRFASRVWAAIAQYGKQDAKRQKAIDNLYKTSIKHQPTLETLDERGARQQSVLGRIDT